MVIQGVSHLTVKLLTINYLIKKSVSGVSLFHETPETLFLYLIGRLCNRCNHGAYVNFAL
jgi:hypothetical protein